MEDEKKYEGAGYPIKIFLKEALEKQRNAMMDTLPDPSTTATHLHLAATLKVRLPLRYK